MLNWIKLRAEFLEVLYWPVDGKMCGYLSTWFYCHQEIPDTYKIPEDSVVRLSGPLLHVLPMLVTIILHPVSVT